MDDERDRREEREEAWYRAVEARDAEIARLESQLASERRAREVSEKNYADAANEARLAMDALAPYVGYGGTMSEVAKRAAEEMFAARDGCEAANAEIAKHKKQRDAALARLEEATALLKEWRETPFFESAEDWGRWVGGFRPKVDTFLAAKGAK